MKHLKTIFACLLMAVLSIGQVWGADAASVELCTSWSQTFAYATAYTHDYSIDNLNGGTTTMTLGVQGVYRQANANTYFQMNKKTGYFKNTTALPGKITKIETTWSVAKGATKCYFANGAEATSSDATVTVSAGTSVTYTPDNAADYYFFNIDVSTGSGSAQMTSCVVYYEKSGSAPSPSVSVDPSSWNFGTVHASNAASKVFSVSGSNLTAGDLTLTVPDGFSVSPSSIAVDGTLTATDVTVSKNTSDIDDYAGNLEITGGGLENAKTVALTMTVDADPAPTGTFALFSGDLVEGDYVLVGYQASSSKYYAMNNTVTSNQYLGITEVSIDGNNPIVDPDASLVWTIAQSTNGYYIKNNGAYLDDNATSNKNYAQTVEEPATTSEWTFAYDKGKWTITNYGTVTTKKTLSFNIGSSRVACYTAIQSGNTCFYLYKKVSTDPEVTVSPNALEFTAKQNIAVAGKTFTLTGANLDNGLTLAASTGFSVTPTEITAEAAMAQGGVEVTVTPATPTTTTTPIEGTVTISGGASATVNLSMTVTPTFAVALTVNDGEMGSATMNDGTATIYVTDDEEITLVATPANGHEFVNWTVSDENIVLGNANNATTTAIAGAAGTITANFQAQACTGLAAPTLDAVTKTYNSATITWNTVSNADSYAVSVVKHSNSESIFSGNVNALLKELTGLDANTQYDYTVMAVGDGTSYCDENNSLLEGSFTTNDYPAATLSLVENGGDPYAFAGSHKLNDVVTLPSELQGLGCTGKVLVGWSSVEIAEAVDEEPAANYWAAGAEYTLSATSQTLYAVFGTQTGGAWTEVEITSISESDVIIVAGVQDGKNYYGLSSAQGTSSSPSAVELTVEDNTITDGVVEAIKWNLKGTAGNYILYANGTDNYLYNTAATTSTSGTNTAWRVGQPTSGTIRKLLKENGTTLSTNESSNVRYLCQYNNSDWRGYVNNTSNNAKTTLAFFKQSSSTTGYTTSCSAANPKVATPVINGVTSSETYTTSKTITLTCETEGATIYYSLDGADAAAYTEAFSVETYGAHTITAYATKTDYDNSDEASASFTLNLPFASLAELVAANVATGTEVTVTFNEVITGIYSNSQSKKKGIYLTTLAANEKAIEIYYNQGEVVVPSSWTIGGQVAATAMTFTWTYYSGGTQWELVPLGTEWTWENGDLSYTAPKAVSSIAIKAGSVPTQTTYADGGTFNPAGMTVTFTYTDETTKDITSADPEWAAIEWTFDPPTLSEGENVTVTVTATYNELDSDPFEVTGITVTGIPTKTTAEFIEAEGVRCYLEGIVSNIATGNSYKYGNFDLTDESGSIYIYGCLTASGEAQKFGEIGIVEGDKIKVLAETYEYYNKHEAKNVRFVEKLPQSVESVSLDETSKTLKKGQSFNLTATITPVGADNKNVTWSSNNTGVATVADGVVTAKTAGTARITVTTEDGGKTAYCDVTVNEAYTVTYNTSGSTGTTPVDANTYEAGDPVTLAPASGLSNAGHFFDQWAVTYVDGESETQTVTVEDGKFVMPAANVTVTATWARKSSDKWIKVNATSELVAGEKYVIASAVAYPTDAELKSYYAISTTQNSNNRKATPVDVANGILTGSSAMEIFELVDGGSEMFAFKAQSNNKYLCTATGGNYLRSQDDVDANSKWEITITDGVFSVVASSSTYRNVMQFNYASTNQIFACYQSANQKAVAIYKKAPVERIEDGQNINISTIDENADVIVESGGVLNVNSVKQIGDLTVENGGKVVLDANKLTVVGTFTIETTMASGNSGQLTGATASNFAATGEAYIDITLGAGARSDQWHAFTVPFPVDAINGVFDLDGTQLINETNYAIMEYLGDVRATGAYGWKKIRTTLLPGTFYLMTVDGLRTTYRFKKVAGAAIVAGNSKSVSKYAASGEGTSVDAGWNGVGNPTLTYGKVDAEVQVLDPVSYTYIKKDANSTNFVVGTPFFYQAAADGSISMVAASGTTNYAPHRVAANGIEKIKVAFGNEDFTDYLDISASEEATNEYVIGKDLAKMMMTSTPRVAQIYGKAYGTNLCMIDAPMVNNQAEYKMTLYVPEDGEYAISAPASENAEVYLTKDGAVIWNLSMSEYTHDFAKGFTTGYGLLLQAKAPMTPTGMDAVQGGKAQTTKIIIDEHVYILRGEKMYDATGRLVK